MFFERRSLWKGSQGCTCVYVRSIPQDTDSYSNRDSVGKQVNTNFQTAEAFIISNEFFREILCLHSSFITSLISTVPAHLETVIIFPDSSSSSVEHIVRILETGVTDIVNEERKNNFKILEEALELGIDFENVSCR